METLHIKSRLPVSSIIQYSAASRVVLVNCQLVVGAHSYGKRFIVRADDMLTAFWESLLVPDAG